MSAVILSKEDSLVKNFLRQKVDEYESAVVEQDYFDYAVNWSYVKERLETSSETIIAIIKDQTIIGFCLVQETLPEKFSFTKEKVAYSPWIYTAHTGWEEDLIAYELLDYLKENYSSILLEWDNGCESASERGFLPLDTAFSKGNFIFHDDDCGLYVWGIETNFLVKGYLPVVMDADQSEPSYCVKTDKEFVEEFYNGGEWKIPLYETSNNYRNFLGFRYFHPSDVTRGYDFLAHNVLAINSRGEVVGVIRVGEYSHGSVKFKGICYVDVHWAYRKRGIAKALFLKLNEMLTSDDIVIGSHLSDEGKQAHMDVIMTQAITACPCYKDDDDFYLNHRINWRDKFLVSGLD